MKTYMPTKGSVERQWWVVDANGKTLGRLCAVVASVLAGKTKPTFTPHADVGDHVIVVNADKIRLSGRKLDDKMYRWHSGYIGGLKEISARRMLATRPERVVEWGVAGMLPKSRLGRAMYRKLKVYAGPEHPHQAQQPQPLALGD